MGLESLSLIQGRVNLNKIEARHLNNDIGNTTLTLALQFVVVLLTRKSDTEKCMKDKLS